MARGHVKGRGSCDGVSARPTGRKLVVCFYRTDGVEETKTTVYNPRKTLKSQVQRVIGCRGRVKSTEVR